MLKVCKSPCPIACSKTKMQQPSDLHQHSKAAARVAVRPSVLVTIKFDNNNTEGNVTDKI